MQAQYSLSWDGEPIGDTMVIVGDPADTELVFHAILTNGSDDSDSILVKRRIISVLDGLADQLCWGLCYLPNTDSIFISPSGMRINAGESTEEAAFSGHYLNREFDEPIGVIGTSVFEYTFFNADDENENVVVIVKFVTSPDGIADKLMVNGYISEIYPNPATSHVSLDYNLTSDVDQANLRIVNILGAVVKDINLNRNDSNHRLDISDLESGVYFYSMLINNEVYKTKKLVVR
jgi:hypothetical protein